MTDRRKQDVHRVTAIAVAICVFVWLVEVDVRSVYAVPLSFFAILLAITAVAGDFDL